MTVKLVSHILATGILTIALASLTSCEEQKIYHAYAHSERTVWDKGDAFLFMVPPMKSEGTYLLEADLRITREYPYTGLTLIIDQTVIHTHNSLLPHSPSLHHADTLSCRLAESDGNTLGKGINFLQYEFPVRHMELKKGDSLVIGIRHYMKQETLPGVSDIGISIKSL